jgi:hypothetical protein
MAISEVTNSSSGTSISTTEYSILNASTSLSPSTTSGVYQIFLDLTNMVAGDQYRLRVYEKIISGGTQRVLYEPIFTDAQLQALVALPTLILMWGWDVTLKRLAGSDRSIGWSIRRVA